MRRKSYSSNDLKLRIIAFASLVTVSKEIMQNTFCKIQGFVKGMLFVISQVLYISIKTRSKPKHSFVVNLFDAVIALFTDLDLQMRDILELTSISVDR